MVAKRNASLYTFPNAPDMKTWFDAQRDILREMITAEQPILIEHGGIFLFTRLKGKQEIVHYEYIWDRKKNGDLFLVLLEINLLIT